jgi:hypothetical protein
LLMYRLGHGWFQFQMQFSLAFVTSWPQQGLIREPLLWSLILWNFYAGIAADHLNYLDYYILFRILSKLLYVPWSVSNFISWSLIGTVC